MAVAGERVAVNLAGLEVAEVPRGSVLATPARLPADAAGRRRADRAAEAPRRSSTARACACTRARRRCWRGSSVGGIGGRCRPGAAAPARLRLERPAVLARGDRFILRTYSPLATIGGGVVLDPDPPRSGVRSARAAARFAALQRRDDPDDDARAALLQMLG